MQAEVSKLIEGCFFLLLPNQQVYWPQSARGDLINAPLNYDTATGLDVPKQALFPAAKTSLNTFATDLPTEREICAMLYANLTSLGGLRPVLVWPDRGLRQLSAGSLSRWHLSASSHSG